MFLFFVVVILAVVAGVVAWRRLPQSVREDLRHLAREVRIFTGAYDLKCVVERMRSEMIASALPSLTKSFVPNEMWFGLAPRDFQRWGGFGDGVVEELAQLLADAIKVRKNFQLLGDGQVYVYLFENPDAGPGRPSFTARVRSEPSAEPEADTPEHSRSKPDPDPSTGLPSDGPSAATSVLTETELIETSTGEHWLLYSEGRSPVVIVEELILGRDPEADMTFTDSTVSRRHARLALLDDRVSLIDLDSANGTFVNEQPVRMAILEPGDRIRLGHQTVITIEHE